ncbi:hypothetical protein P0Y35_05180 [Kiritimatiellaeota bacterium B1221]|nr:hypothetical protein [Kiritimatiellaeota bacterium B1221]
MKVSPRLQDWVEDLASTQGHRVELSLTRNRRTMISLRQISRHHTRLRMHHAFSDAPQHILNDLASYIQTREPAYWKRVSAFARNIPPAATASPRPLPTRPGIHFDLQTELDYVKQHFFDSPPEAGIAWGKPGVPRKRKRRSIRFGSWHADCRQVHIHPVLDQAWVSKDFMHYLIYHELCHAAAPPYTDSAGRHHIHHAEFKSLERRYPNLKQMQKSGKEIFERLIQEHL